MLIKQAVVPVLMARLSQYHKNILPLMLQIFILFSMLTLITPSAQSNVFDPTWSFANISLNYLNWSKGTEHRTKNNAAKGDFFYLELEGGVGYNWGEFYGFADLENPTYNTHESDGRDHRRTAVKITSHIYLGESPFSVYLHIYDFRDYGYDAYEQDQVLGFGFRHNFSNGIWFKPFLGAAHVESNAYSGMNGYMLGWVAGYDFKLFDENFSITNWHELTFDRDKEYLYDNYVEGKAGEVGNNGALALWWHPIEKITTGIQYRYSINKLGTPDAFQNAIIYSVKFNF